MRISDWSSDVCSSDLEAVLLVEQADEHADDDREIKRGDRDAGDHPELFADDREDIVGVRFGQLEFGEARAGAGADQPPRGKRRMRLVDLKAVALVDRKSQRLNSRPYLVSAMPSSALTNISIYIQ